ncbi:MAG: hypothetical protein PHS45_01125 [Bacilli bacterium]|nr:hypothetical protein [Bacilli bacterium]
MKYKVLIVLFVLTLFIFGAGITYSMFYSGATLGSNNQDVAKFIFNTESLDQLQMPLIDLNPGDNEEYLFSVSNNYLGNISDVSVEYHMTIKTYHLVPLIIELYKMDGANEELILTCDETYTRNSQNELICNTPIQEMGHVSEELDNYKLKVNFPSEYNDVVYSDLVDYINIGIESWQKIKE